MSKAFTHAEFSSQVDRDRTWRIREISDLKSAIRRADDQTSVVLLRALCAICYAHWEGHVRFAAEKYLDYIARQKYQYAKLVEQFYRNKFLPRLSGLAKGGGASHADLCALIDNICGATNERFSKIDRELISTKSNLKSEVLKDICNVCSVPFEYFEEKHTFIDVMLLKRRNEIAHGVGTEIAPTDADSLIDTTIEIMRFFSTALENHVYCRDYLRSTPGNPKS